MAYLEFFGMTTGITLIDQQHSDYMALVKRFTNSVASGDMSPLEVSEGLSETVDYALNHFEAEEALMRSIDYPEYDAHRSKHDSFREKLDILLLKVFVDSPDQNATKLDALLMGWVENQVLTDDAWLADYIRKHNLEIANQKHFVPDDIFDNA